MGFQVTTTEIEWINVLSKQWDSSRQYPYIYIYNRNWVFLEIGYFLKLGSPISPLGFPLNMPKNLDDFGVSHCGKPRVGLRGRLQQTYCMYLPVKTMVSVYQNIENSNIALQNYATVPNQTMHVRIVFFWEG